MKIKICIKDFLWMATGALMLLLVMVIVIHFQTGKRPVEQLAFRAKRMDLVPGCSICSAADYSGGAHSGRKLWVRIQPSFDAI